MIKLNNLEKYFNRNRSNEIHVINDINLTLPDKGLVVLLGPSGSGKTTLLNVLGGLDKVQSGTIDFDGQSIRGYSSGTWDKIRNKKVGYIFQNYNLLTNLTVYDNIALTLNMINIYDKEEIDKRIDYILDSMGMINYRKRRASQLSGGQQQRVAIARALAKNPKVIIADEPTGNLDSKNTQDIMRIIKKISETKLVVLVTHEENIANFYGDRIIKLKDGEIVSDKSNRSNGSLDMRHETDIYLGDMNDNGQLQNPNTILKLYSDEDIQDDLNIRLIVKNKTIYLDVDSKEYSKVQLLEHDSEINIYEGQFEDIDHEEREDFDFHFESIIDESRSESFNRHSVITVKDSYRLARARITNTSRMGKAMFVGFGLIGLLVALAVGLLSGILNMNPDRFLTGSEEIWVFDKQDLEYSDIKEIEAIEAVNYLVLQDRMTFYSDLPPIYQNTNSKVKETRYFEYKEFMEGRMILGTEANKINEFVIDSTIADKMIEASSYQSLGVNTYNDLMQLEYYVNLPGMNEDGEDYQVPIVLAGIVDSDESMVYASKEIIFMGTYGVGLYEYFQDDITTTVTDPFANDFKTLILESTFDTEPANNVLLVHDTSFAPSGTFTSENEVPRILTTMDDLEHAYFLQNITRSSSQVHVHVNDETSFQTYMDSLDLEEMTIVSTYEDQLEDYRSDRLQGSLATIIFTGVVLGASAISFFFILRSSLLSRIYEVSVYRALGVSKGDVRKMFLVETLFITTITSFIGYLAMTFILWRIQILGEDFFEGVIYISPISIAAGILIIYIVNVFAGLLPVSNLLRRTPAEILSKYDF